MNKTQELVKARQDTEALELWLLRWRYDSMSNEHEMTAHELASHIISCGWSRTEP